MDGDAAFQRPGHQFFTGIADPRAAGVGDQRAVLARRDPIENRPGALRLGERRQADRLLAEPIVLQQDSGVSGVLANDESHLLQRLQRPRRDVRQIADRSSDQEELARAGHLYIPASKALGMCSNAAFGPRPTIETTSKRIILSLKS